MSYKITDRQKSLLLKLTYNAVYTMEEIRLFPENTDVSLSSTKRDITSLINIGYVNMTGQRKASNYTLTGKGLLYRDFSIENYFKNQNYRKDIITSYNFDLLDIVETEDIFTVQELLDLEEATSLFRHRGEGSSEQLIKKELERFVIELSWKSSKIEGNTYTLLDTEKLIREGIPSSKNTASETAMILNHKKAFAYIRESITRKKDIQSFRELENIHRLLVEDLGINHGLRKKGVGVTGTRYLPLDVGSQIEEQTRKIVSVVQTKTDSFSKALISVLMISYLQAFEDGNKRTARLFANAMLLQSDLAPLSYRDVDETEYREAMLIFYEQNSLEAFKKIFIEQYIFSCKTYNLG